MRKDYDIVGLLCFAFAVCLFATAGWTILKVNAAKERCVAAGGIPVTLMLGKVACAKPVVH